MDAAELELDYENSDTTGTGTTQSISVRKNIPIKLKGKGRGKVRAKTSTPASTRNVKKNTTKKASDDVGTEENDENVSTKFDMEGDISKLEAPTFTTIDRGPPEPMHRNTKLRWDHKVNLIGEKVVNPMLHCCEKCKLPILIYGRMIPCKHVFCLDCAEKSGTACPRCKDKVQRVENTGLGTVHMCTFGGSRHGNNGCRRTYLSQRDLQAHVNHRHLRTASHHDASSTQSNSTHHVQTPTQSTTPQPQPHTAHADYESRDPREARSGTHETVPSRNLPPPHHPPVHSHPPPLLPHPPDTTVLPPPLPMTSSYHARDETHQPPTHIPGRPHIQFTQPPPNAGQPPPSHGYASPIPVMSTRTNLITVPIQDDTNAGNTYRSTHQTPPPYHHPPPPQQQPTGPVTYLQHPPPQHPYSHPPPSHLPVTYTQGNQTPLVYANPGQVFNQPPPTHFPPPLLPPPSPSTGGPSMFAAPPPGPIHHPPPVGHGGPPPQYGSRPRFNPSGQPVFEDSHLSSSPYNVSGRPWARGPPPLRPLGSNPNIGPIQNRPPYYHQ